MIFYYFLLLLPISAVVGLHEDPFWMVKTGLVLTSDSLTNQIQICTSMEDLLIENAEDLKKVSKSADDVQHDPNLNNLVELVVTNPEGEEVAIHVTSAVYNLIYKRTDPRKNPNTFYRPPKEEHDEECPHGPVPSSGVKQLKQIKLHEEVEKGNAATMLNFPGSNPLSVNLYITSNSTRFVKTGEDE